MGIINEISDLFLKLKKIAKFAKDQATMSLLMDLQEKFIELREENANLKERLKENQDVKEIEKRIVRNNGDAADYTDENGNQLVICTNCWDNNRKIIQVQHLGYCEYFCGVCKQHKYKVNK